ncbi:MAG TPA: Holliday junction resolvase RuvX [Saprospiraceae bacterium]|nr:Holliday junction resolvase RuvX [Saprospiraceae bacterium]
MARIVGIDYGGKRTGIAATDSLQIIVSPITTVETKNLIIYLCDYTSKEVVEKIVIGLPTHKDGNYTNLKQNIDKFVADFSKIKPEIPFDFQDESFTSVEAKAVIFQSGVNKKKRQDKSLVDKISAVLILQKYLNHI